MPGTTLFIAAFLVFVVANIQYAGLVVTIRQHCEEYYERIGRPPALFVTPLNVGAAWSFMVYILLGEFNGDEPPEQVVGSLRAQRMLFLSAFGLFALAIAASFI